MYVRTRTYYVDLEHQIWRDFSPGRASILVAQFLHVGALVSRGSTRLLYILARALTPRGIDTCNIPVDKIVRLVCVFRVRSPLHLLSRSPRRTSYAIGYSLYSTPGDPPPLAQTAIDFVYLWYYWQYVRVYSARERLRKRVRSRSPNYCTFLGQCSSFSPWLYSLYRMHMYV